MNIWKLLILVMSSQKAAGENLKDNRNTHNSNRAFKVANPVQNLADFSSDNNNLVIQRPNIHHNTQLPITQKTLKDIFQKNEPEKSENTRSETNKRKRKRKRAYKKARRFLERHNERPKLSKVKLGSCLIEYFAVQCSLNHAVNLSQQNTFVQTTIYFLAIASSLFQNYLNCLKEYANHSSLISQNTIQKIYKDILGYCLYKQMRNNPDSGEPELVDVNQCYGITQNVNVQLKASWFSFLKEKYNNAWKFAVLASCGLSHAKQECQEKKDNNSSLVPELGELQSCCPPSIIRQANTDEGFSCSKITNFWK